LCSFSNAEIWHSRETVRRGEQFKTINLISTTINQKPPHPTTPPKTTHTPPNNIPFSLHRGIGNSTISLPPILYALRGLIHCRLLFSKDRLLSGYRPEDAKRPQFPSFSPHLPLASTLLSPHPTLPRVTTLTLLSRSSSLPFAFRSGCS